VAALSLRRAGFLQRLSDASEHRRDFPLGQIIAALEAGEGLCDLASRHGLLTDPAEEAHLRRDWYGEGEPDRRSRWWPEHDVERLVREGYVRAFKGVRDRDLPLAAYWLSGHHDFVVAVLPSRFQMTLLLLTPDPRPMAEAAEQDAGVTIREIGGRLRIDGGAMK
jgi:hypothetical protein